MIAHASQLETPARAVRTVAILREVEAALRARLAEARDCASQGDCESAVRIIDGILSGNTEERSN